MKDIDLKLRLRRILWGQGYHCPLEVDLSHFEYEENGRALKRSPITDIDVLGLRFEPDLRLSIVIGDCKSGQESEPNRLFWLRGVMDFFGAEEGIFVKTRLHRHGRALAPRLGIRVMDDTALASFERALNLANNSFDVSDKKTYKEATQLWGVNVPSGNKPTEGQLRLKNVYQYLQYLYWMIEEYRNIQTIIDRFAQIKGELGNSGLKAKYLVHIGLQRLALSILRMAGHIAGRNITDIRREARIYLFGGSLLLREREHTIRLLEQLKQPELFSEKLTLEPPFFNELVEIINRMIQGSGEACKILQHLDAILLEHILGAKRDLAEILGEKYSTDALVLAKRIASLFQKSAGLSARLLEEVSSL